MSTNKIVLRSVEEFMADYQPIYKPIFPLLMSKAKAYAEETGKLEFRRVETVGDIRAKHILPKDTEIKQISVMEGKKTFKKYFLSNQFRLSTFQDREGIEEVSKQVMDEHNVQFDSMLLTGEGTSNSTMINNGLFFSNDANYTEESSVAIASGDGRLADFHAKVVANANTANQVSGQKLLVFYGSNILPLFNSVYPSAAVAFKKVLADVLGSDYSMIELPAASTPSSSHGWMIINLDQIQLHYTTVPKMLSQGINEENLYYWSNFLIGSCMVEVLAKNGIVKQPATLA